LIQGYPGRASVAAGERLRLHVATDAKRFRVRFFRWGGAFELLDESPWLAGKSCARGNAALAWDWPEYEFEVPASWPSGVFIAHLVETEAGAASAPPDLAATTGAVLFVVRARQRAQILYKLPLATYHAYNCEGDGCYYYQPPRSVDPPGSRVTLHRPGGGIGGQTFGALDHYDPRSPRQTFAHWDAPFIRWLAQHGYQLDFCTDFDLHRDGSLIEGYRLLLNVGHDEYWSSAMRDCVESFISAGGNVAFFGANLCWWRIHVVDGGTAIVCHQGGPTGAVDHWWPVTGVHRPEDSLTGVSYRHGGGWWDGPRRTDGYFVQAANHWAFANTGLADGQSFGRDTVPPLVGYECDGAPLAQFDIASSRAVLAPDASQTGTPETFTLLAVAPLSPEWDELPPREHHAAGEGVHAATMGVYTRNGIVFTAGTTDWAQVLEQDRNVAAITRNVVERLLA
jgi:hypothetical protein